MPFTTLVTQCEFSRAVQFDWEKVNFIKKNLKGPCMLCVSVSQTEPNMARNVVYHPVYRQYFSIMASSKAVMHRWNKMVAKV